MSKKTTIGTVDGIYTAVDGTQTGGANAQTTAAKAATPATVGGVNTAPSFSEATFPSIVTTDFGGTGDGGNAILLQADGKLLVAGSSNVNGDNNADFAVARYNLDGSLDTSFSSDGKVTTDLGSGFSDYGISTALQTDGKILVAGTTYTNHNNTSSDISLVRYNADGSLDSSFGTGGIVNANVGGYDNGNSVAIQADGKILVAGNSSDAGGSNYDFSLFRYNTDGSLDTSFSSDGIVTTNLGGANDYAVSSLIQADGKIILFGQTDAGGGGSNFALVRYNADGSLDTSFAGTGIVNTNIGAQDAASSATLEADGKILVVGQIWNNAYSSSDIALVRYNADGSLDTSFGGTGKVTINIGARDYGSAITVEADGKILVAGTTSGSNNQNRDFVLIRYNPDGSLDSSFGNQGIVKTNVGSSATDSDYASSITIEPSGIIDVAGTSNGNFALVRYNPDGSLATSESTAQPKFVEQGPAIKLDSSLILADAELGATNNYAGASITLARQGGASADDVFTLDTTGASFTLFQNQLVYNNAVFGNYTSSNGTLTLNFTGLGTAATGALVSNVLQHVLYSDSAAALPSQVALVWTANDGNTGAQGSGGALTGTHTTTVQMVSVNDAPAGASKTIAIPVTAAYAVKVGDFGFTDPNDSPANNFANVIITQLPAAGSLSLLGQAVTLNQVIPVGEITSGLLQFTPAAGVSGAHYASIGFKVQDDGGTANGGVDTDTTARLLTFDVGNHAPTGSVLITGLATQGQILTASNTLADADGLGAISYTWKNGTTVLGTGANYTVQAGDVGAHLTVTASYTDATGVVESKTKGSAGRSSLKPVPNRFQLPPRHVVVKF
jgi:uncharacterized delta-60 repeat protein